MAPRIIELEEGWRKMEEGFRRLKRILEDLPEPPLNTDEYMLLYTTIYNMCTQTPPHYYAGVLYERYKQLFVRYNEDTVLPALRQKHDELMLKELVRRWLNHKVLMRWLSRFFNYLDRYFIVKENVPTLRDVGFNCFRDQVYRELRGRARDAIINLIHIEREGIQIDQALLKNAVAIFIELGLENHYMRDFERRMLQDTAAYYSWKATIWIEEDSCPDYMLKVEQCLRKEKDRVAAYLHADTEEKLLEQVRHQLLWLNHTQLLGNPNSGCLSLLKNDKVHDLSRMYRLYSRIPKGLEAVGKIFKEHIVNEGKDLVQQAEDTASSKAGNAGGSYEQVFVRKVIDLHEKVMDYVVDCFGTHTICHKAMKTAFETFLNKGVAGSSSAELLATFCDNVLKKGGPEKPSDEDIEDSLERVVVILAYVNDKDMFAEFSRKKLSRRLLFDRSASDEHERSLLSKLKQYCGSQFTSKMEGMVTDLTLARENQTHFEEFLQGNSNANPGFDLSVTVLTTGFWPSYKSSDFALPPEMAKATEAFKGYYATKTKHRKLTFINSMGTCNITGKFDTKTIELIVGTYQGAVLLLFNSTDRLSYSEIAEELNLANEDLIRVLHSLSCAKYKILVKEPSSQTVSQTDTFSFNSSFTDKMRRIRIPLPTVDERKKVVEDVNHDRRYAIDAAIVRVMKSRKELLHQQLITECVGDLSRSFKPDIKAIKKRIEDLITREYIERDAKNPQLFRYLA